MGRSITKETAKYVVKIKFEKKSSDLQPNIWLYCGMLAFVDVLRRRGLTFCSIETPLAGELRTSIRSANTSRDEAIYH